MDLCILRLLFFTNERVKNGLANARAKGKQIGRKKLRDSVLIRKLLKAGLTFRAIGSIAKTSHGSVWAEKKAMLLEEKAAREKADAEKKEAEAYAKKFIVEAASKASQSVNVSTGAPQTAIETTNVQAPKPETP